MAPHENDQSTSPDPIETAEAAGLRDVSDEEPGVRRRKCGRGFTYLDHRDRTVRDSEVRARIDALAIPPAWTDVWICVDEDGHLQATGRDEEGRKQYRYHPRWRRVRDREKYRRLLALGSRLPVLRQSVGRLLDGRELDRERIVAGAVRLLDLGALRLGNDAYTEENDSFGLTTLRRDHVAARGARLRFRFVAKSGQERDVVVRDEALARLLRDLRRVEEERLFVFRNGGDDTTRLRPEHVNGYLREVLRSDVTAKDFRTWAGSVQVLLALSEPPDVREEDRHAVVLHAIDTAAGILGNKRTTARNFYVHPGLVHAFESGALAALVRDASLPPSRPGFRKGERLLLALLPRLDALAEEAAEAEDDATVSR